MSEELSGLRARISAQERQTVATNARIEELAEELAENIKTIASDMSTRFEQVDQCDAATETTMAEQFKVVHTKLATTVTHAELEATEKRLLDAIKRMLDERLPPNPSKE